MLRHRREPWGPCGEEDCADSERHGVRDFTERHTLWREHVRELMEQEPGQHWFFGGRRFMGWWAGPGRINPLVGLMLSKGGGVLPVLVLHLLAQRPRYGNDIMREIQTRSKGTWASNPGAIYPLMRLLEHHGLVSGEWEDEIKRTRRVYRLTEEGKQEYAHLKELMKPGLREAVEVMRGVFEELYAEDVFAPAGVAPGPRTT
jgi:PadR family transcriptional regulator PadR